MVNKSSLPGAPSLKHLYAGVYQHLAEIMSEGHLTTILNEIHRSGLEQSLPVSQDESIRRIMGRLGWLGQGSAEATGKRAEDIIREISSVVDRTPAVVSVLFRLYADGLYGVLPEGICANPPKCRKCVLTKICAYHNAPPGKVSRTRERTPPERLRQGGPEALSDEELLAIVLGGGRVKARDMEVSEELLDRYGSLRKLAKANVIELESYASVTKPAALRTVAATSLALRLMAESRQVGPSVRSGKDFYDLYHGQLRDLSQEVFMVILLDQRHRVMREEQVSQGTLTRALVHPREVFGPAIRECAAAVALVHNHPSGDPTPSKEDKALTARLKSAANVVGIRLLDHVIIGEGVYTSFVDESIL